MQADQPDQRPSQLLEPLQSTCLYRQEDWWTYEVCPKKHVRQFHQHGQELLSQYQLGIYDGNASNVRACRLVHERLPLLSDMQASPS